MEILLGKTNGSDLKIWTASDADNGHILETGRSGSGKTYAMQILEERIANEREAVLWFWIIMEPIAMSGSQVRFSE